jgi:predicted amidophosphoribosyltransferase
MEGAIKEAIHAFKYRNIRVAAPELGQLLAQYLEAHPMPGEVLVPVPLHSHRLRGRGYNQAAVLARELGRFIRFASKPGSASPHQRYSPSGADQ